MPMLNMTAALTNPYTLDVFDVVRRAEAVSAQGLSVITPITFSSVRGVVTPAGDNALQRKLDEQEQGKGVEVTTMFGLRGSAKDGIQQSWQPDLIVWRGNQFVVMDVKDYGAYALGFVQAECEMLDFVALPPTMGGGLLTYPPLPVAVTRGKYPPLEALDGVRKVFTFPALPGSSNNYLLIWNGVIQDELVAVGQVITLTNGGAPKLGDSFYIIVY